MIAGLIKVKEALISLERYLHEIAGIHALNGHIIVGKHALNGNIIVGKQCRAQGADHGDVDFRRHGRRYEAAVTPGEYASNNAVLSGDRIQQFPNVIVVFHVHA